MIQYDTHIHTSFSSDSDTKLSSMIEQASAINLKGLIITDHMDINFPTQYEQSFTFSPKEYEDTIANYRSKTDIQLLTGIELGLQTNCKEDIQALLAHYNYDYIIGSIHVVKQMDPYHSHYWESFSTEHEAVLCYFETMLECLQIYDNFDSLGHLDYIKRYAPSKSHASLWTSYSDILDAILSLLVDKDIALEVNTAGYKTGNSPNPDIHIIERFRELGGERITIGSDAHIPSMMCSHFHETAALLKENGFPSYTVFIDRKPYEFRL